MAGLEPCYTIKKAGELPGDYETVGMHEVQAYILHESIEVIARHGLNDQVAAARALQERIFLRYGIRGFTPLVCATFGLRELPPNS